MKITIEITLPEGATVEVSAKEQPENPLAAPVIPVAVDELMQQLMPSRYRDHARSYVERCINDLGCSVEMPSGNRQREYLNLFPPPHCRRARVAAVAYSSTRTPVYTGAIDLDGFVVAEQTLNNGSYVHPKLAHLDSEKAVDEAVRLTQRAIKRLER